MADQTAVKIEQASQANKPAGNKALLVGDLVQAAVQADGDVVVKETLTTLKLVDIADVDLLLTFANGDHVVIVNGALDALSPNPPDAIFSDKKILLTELFKLVGVVNPAKAGSLRLVSENIDANPPPEMAEQAKQLPDTPPPAPMVKVGVGTSTGVGKGPGAGIGAGNGEGEVPATVVPPISPSITSYSKGHPTQSVVDLNNAIGNPNVTAALYTSVDFKVIPSGRTDLPLGAYDVNGTTAQLAERSGSAAQSTIEMINGTAGNDTIAFNPAFSAGDGQWVKTLHLTFNNFSSIDAIQLVFNPIAIQEMAGFGLQVNGVDLVLDSGKANSWHVTPTAAMLTQGLDINIVYFVNDSHAPVNFGADVIVDGQAGPFVVPTQTTNLFFTWSDNFTLLDDNGNPRMVLPRSGVGVEILAGDGNDTVTAGAGADLVHGGNGADSLDGGFGNDILDGGAGADTLIGNAGEDTATYEYSTSGVIASLDTNAGLPANTGEAAGDTYSSIENLTGSAFADTLIGNSTANVLKGGDGNDTLIGGGGFDTLDGGTGNNTASYVYASSAVTANLTTGSGSQGEALGDKLINIQNLTGSSYNDTLIGNTGTNILSGGAGDDTLIGMGGGDTYDGGANGIGGDTVSYAPSAAGVIATLTTGIGVANTGDAAGDIYLANSIENLTGTAFDDTLIGNNANNILSGGLGNNTLEGLAGADTLVGGAGVDTASYAHASAGVISSLTTTFTSGPTVNQLGDAAGDSYVSIENITGSNFDDTLIGNLNANTLTGGAGNNILEGMGGADVLIGGTGSDTASYAHATALVNASLTDPLILGSGFVIRGDALGDTYNSIENLEGSDFSDILVGDAQANILSGNAGDDKLIGGLGGDTLNGGLGTDTASYEYATLDVVASLTDNSIAQGEAVGDIFNDIENLTGGSGNDTFTGAAGSIANAFDGGAGNDTVSYAQSTAGVVAKLDTSNATIAVIQTNDAAGDTFVRIENLTGSGYDDTLIGNAGVNVLTGGLGNNILEGLAGGDSFIGNVGTDTVSYAHSTLGVVSSLTTGLAGVTQTNDAAGDTYFSIENMLGTEFVDNLIGNSGVNNIAGGLGNDILEGLGGADTLDGGLGADTASYSHSTGDVTVSLFTSSGTQGDAAGDVLISIENLQGGSGNDTFISGTGLQANAFDGGLGTDTVSYATSLAGVTATLDTGIGVANINEADGDTYISIENLVGSAFDDTLIGNINANTLTGGDGNDILEGRGGADVFDGGVGSDTVSYAHSSLGVVSMLATSVPTGPVVTQTNDALGDTYNLIENLSGSAYADTLIGDANANILTGGAGNDVLEGLGGADTFNGGSDTDTVSYEHSLLGVVSSLTTTFSAGPAVTQTNDAFGDTYNSIENMIGTAQADNLIGDNVANSIAGGAGNDVLEGMGGGDVLDGGAGTDTASYEHAVTFVNASLTTGLAGFIAQGDAAGDSYIGVEDLLGTDYNDTLIGNSAANTLTGAAGDDILEGLGGADTLVGGAGVNTASYEHSPDLGASVGVTASLLTPASNTGDALGDTYSNIQNLLGSAFDDTLTGDANNNMLTGGAGNDTITGGLGVDTLWGGDGNDNLFDDGIGASILDGGNGNDVITLTSNDAVVDTVNGGAGIDTLVYAFAGGGQRVDVNLQLGTVYYYSYGGVKTNFTGIENFTITGTNNYSYVYANNFDNVLIGNTTANPDYIDYSYAIGGVNVNLATGVVTGGSGNDTLINFDHIYGGSYFDDVLVGDAGNNTIRGLSGNDVIDGGLGIDTWYIDYTGARVTASLLTAAQNAAMGIVMTGDASGDTVTNMENITSSYSDFLYGNEVSNNMYGAGMIEGFLGNDVIRAQSTITSYASYANAGNAYLASQGITSGAGVGVVASLTTSFSVGPAVITTGDAAGDTYDGNVRNMMGSAFNDTLIGNTNANILNGGAGDDILEGLAGADSLMGGAGIDTASYVHASSSVTVDLSAAGVVVQTGDAAGDTYSGIENITGSNFDDFLYGNSQDNILIGGLGNDLLDGGAGNDTASYFTATGAVTINLSTNTATGAAGNDTLVSIEQVIGSSFVDTIIGSSGDDVIDGGAGADNINGGAGSDTISYASATGPRSVVLGGANTDGDTLTSIENILGSSYGDALTGDAGDNIIEGGLGDDTLIGGANTAVGDTVSYARASAEVTVNLAIAGAQNTGVTGSDTLSGFENILGSAFGDTLVGDAGGNVINGGAGNDILIGGAGADTLIGGLGNDTVSYATSSAAVSITINGAASGGDAAGDVMTGIENLIGSAGNDTLIGDGNANIFDGGLGNDAINGLGGVDTVTYATAGSAVTADLSALGVNVTGGAGNDSITNIENLVGSAYNDTLTGDGNNNVFEGGTGADTMNGGGGALDSDTVTYVHSSGAVNVSLVLGASNTGAEAQGDVLTNFENITGSAFDDTLIGNAGANVLDGGAGDDVLRGGGGADQLIGGLGIDTASYAGSSAVTVNLTSSTYRGVNQGLAFSGFGGGGDATGDTYSSIENVIGSSNNDAIMGSTDNNVIDGGAGDDRIYGDNGNDIIYANNGYDTAYGENGNDTFYVSTNWINASSLYDGGGNDANANADGRDAIILQGLTGGAYSLTLLASRTNNMEGLNIKGDGANTALGISSSDVQQYCDAGNGSNIWIKADSGDTINVSLSAGETLQTTLVAGGADYTIFNAASAQVAAIHWTTV